MIWQYQSLLVTHMFVTWLLRVVTRLAAGYKTITCKQTFCKKQKLYQTVLCRRGPPIKIIKVKILSWTSLQETFSSTFDDDDLVSQVLQKRTAGGWGCYELRHVLRDCLWIFCILCAVVLLQDLSFQMINGVSLWKCIILNFSTDVEVRITLHDDIKRAT